MTEEPYGLLVMGMRPNGFVPVGTTDRVQTLVIRLAELLTDDVLPRLDALPEVEIEEEGHYMPLQITMQGFLYQLDLTAWLIYRRPVAPQEFKSIVEERFNGPAMEIARDILAPVGSIRVSRTGFPPGRHTTHTSDGLRLQ